MSEEWQDPGRCQAEKQPAWWDLDGQPRWWLDDRQCSRPAGYGYTRKFCWQHVPWKGASRETLLSGRISRERLVEIIDDLRWDLEYNKISDLGNTKTGEREGTGHVK